MLGPAHDGGFYLIGAARTVPAMLEARALWFCNFFQHTLCTPR